MTKSPAPRRSLAARLREPRLWIGLVSAALVTWIAWRAAEEEPGPGPLSSVHAALPELRGAAGCAGCHGVGALGDAEATAAMQAACVTCHAEIGAQLELQRGFHGTLEGGGDCARCHGEHLGRSFEPYSPQVFVSSGFESRAAYDHRGLDFGLTGAHARLDCVACHAHADATGDALATLFAQMDTRPAADTGPAQDYGKPRSASGRFLGLSQACTACHEDAHQGRLGPTCADCHGQERPFPEAANFAHTAAFPLAGAHAGHACTACHVAGSEHAIEAYGASTTRPEERTCVDCHASPHGVAFVSASGSTCATCHAAEPKGFTRADVERSRAAHGATGFALEDAHADVACELCHDPALAFAARHPGRAADACAACHADPHGGQFGAVAATPALCTRCHTTASFTEHKFDAAAHTAAGFALDGAHAAAACAACHAPEHAGAPPRYRGTPRACASCHEDVHRGAFDRPGVGALGAPAALVDHTARAGGAATGTPEGCARCHSTTSFRGIAESFDHARWTTYRLEGAHGSLDCQACHPAEPGSGRRLGPVERVFRPGTTRADVASCAACHADPHAGRFDGVPAATLDASSPDGAARVGCARCHVPESFAEVPAGRFDHGLWTGFALRGAHEHTGCVACHGTGPEPLEPSIRDGRVARRLGAVSEMFAGPVDQCATCHQNPHGARYDVHAPALVEQRIGCARCHGETSFRALVAFEHAWTGYALEGRHADVACAGCHTPLAPDATGRIRGAAAGTGAPTATRTRTADSSSSPARRIARAATPRSDRSPSSRSTTLATLGSRWTTCTRASTARRATDRRAPATGASSCGIDRSGRHASSATARPAGADERRRDPHGPRRSRSIHPVAAQFAAGNAVTREPATGDTEARRPEGAETETRGPRASQSA